MEPGYLSPQCCGSMLISFSHKMLMWLGPLPPLHPIRSVDMVLICGVVVKLGSLVSDLFVSSSVEVF